LWCIAKSEFRGKLLTPNIYITKEDIMSMKSTFTLEIQKKKKKKKKTAK
jgi:hypothetical protein